MVSCYGGDDGIDKLSNETQDALDDVRFFFEDWLDSDCKNETEKKEYCGDFQEVANGISGLPSTPDCKDKVEAVFKCQQEKYLSCFPASCN